MAAFSGVADAMDDDVAHAITCGSAIQIQSKETGYYLQSEEKSLGSGSGQQLITFYNNAGSHNALWNVRPANHRVENQEYPTEPEAASCQLAQPVACGSVVRFTHVSTRRNLHSHGVESVLSHQQEVTGYGTGDGKGDGGDNWRIDCVGGGGASSKQQPTHWMRGAPVRLFHVDTQKYLGTSKNVEFNVNTCGQSCPIMGHLEAFGRSAADAHTLMTTEQGIHLSK